MQGKTRVKDRDEEGMLSERQENKDRRIENSLFQSVRRKKGKQLRGDSLNGLIYSASCEMSLFGGKTGERTLRTT